MFFPIPGTGPRHCSENQNEKLRPAHLHSVSLPLLVLYLEAGQLGLRRRSEELYFVALLGDFGCGAALHSLWCRN